MYTNYSLCCVYCQQLDWVLCWNLMTPMWITVSSYWRNKIAMCHTILKYSLWKWIQSLCWKLSLRFNASKLKKIVFICSVDWSSVLRFVYLFQFCLSWTHSIDCDKWKRKRQKKYRRKKNTRKQREAHAMLNNKNCFGWRNEFRNESKNRKRAKISITCSS